MFAGNVVRGSTGQRLARATVVKESAVSPWYKWFVVGWYLLAFGFLSIYVWRNWQEILCINVYNRINGTNLLFFTWVFVGLLPLVKKFEIFGGKAESDYGGLFTKQTTTLLVEPTDEGGDANRTLNKAKRKERR